MKRISLFLTTTIFLCFFNQSKTHAQAAIIAMIFGDKVASEKFHLSVDLGMNFASLPGLEKQKITNGLYFGLGTFIKLNEKWALTPEFKPISPRGAKSVLPLNDYSTVLTNTTYDIELNYIDVPVLAQYKIKPEFFISAGPQFSFLTSAKQLATGTLPQGNEVELQEKLKSNFESFYISLPVEVGYSLFKARKGKGMDIKVRYNFGLTEMIANTAYGSSKGSTFQVFFSFPFITPKAD